MALKLFRGKESQFEHEHQQIQEIIDCIERSFSDDIVYIGTNILLANTELDCLILTKKGPIILELKNYSGEIIGDENGEWIVRDDEGNSVPLPENLYQQLRKQRNDLYRKLEKIFAEHIPRVEPEDLRKISAWGYFRKGSKYPDDQINQYIVKWFDIVTAETLSYKISHVNPQYTLFEPDFDKIMQELHLTEYEPGVLGKRPDSNEPIREIKPIEGYEPSEIIEMIGKMAQYGHAPSDGCPLFSIGNEEFVNTVKEIFLKKQFNRKSSAEKFVVGQFGSGKTHFINQISEEARKMQCVTCYVALTKNVDVTSNYFIYREIARDIRPPGTKKRGMKSLLNACLSSIEELTSQQTDSIEDANNLLRSWINSLEDQNFELDAFGRVVKQAFDAHLKNDDEKFYAATRWLEGEFDNREITKMLNLSPYTKKEQNIIAKRVNLSLYQLIKLCGFQGTVIAFDEAEQGFNIGKKKQSMLFSLLQSDVNSIISLEGGAVLVLYAIQSHTMGEVMNFPALQQRIQHTFKFSPEHFSSPIIEIERSQAASKEAILEELQSIGQKLVDLMYCAAGSEITVPKESTLSLLPALAERCIKEDMTSSNRRAMVKGTCSLLDTLYMKNILPDIDEISLVPDSDEFEEEEA